MDLSTWIEESFLFLKTLAILGFELSVCEAKVLAVSCNLSSLFHYVWVFWKSISKCFRYINSSIPTDIFSNAIYSYSIAITIYL